MTSEGIGNRLNGIVRAALHALFEQGELAQLSYGAFDFAAQTIRESTDDEITIEFPVGYGANKQPINGSQTYKQEQLLARYEFLASHQLAMNGLVQLVTIVDALLADVTRTVILQYPRKLGMKRTIPLQVALESHSIEEIHLRATDSLLHDMTYKSPAEFAEIAADLISVKLLECPAYHKYMEVKATRDIHVHNRGVANDVYTRKAATHARVKAGHVLPVNVPYFLESYESCLQLTEWLEKELHGRWHSSHYEARQEQLSLPHVALSEQLQLGAGSDAGEPESPASSLDA